MNAIAEGCQPAEFVVGREIECAASRSLCLVPGEIAELYRAVEILIGDKAHSTQVAVSWQQQRVVAPPRKSERRERGPISSAVGRKLPEALVGWGTGDRDAFLRTGIDIAGGSGQRDNGRSIRQTIVLILPRHRRRLNAGNPLRRMVYREVDRSRRRLLFGVDHGTHKKRVRASRQISSERKRQFERRVIPHYVVACAYDLYTEAIGDPRLPIESWAIDIEGLIDR